MRAYIWGPRSGNGTVDLSQPGARGQGQLRAEQVPRDRRRKGPYSQLLLLGQKVVVLIPLVQRDQDVLEPVAHAQWEFSQLGVQAGRDV